MKYSVRIIADAEEDLFSIYRYVAFHDSSDKAEALLSKLEDVCLSLGEFPHRGHVPCELERVGIKTYREVHFKPYRIIYQVVKKDVFIHCVLDGRRDLMDLLRERLLR